MNCFYHLFYKLKSTEASIIMKVLREKAPHLLNELAPGKNSHIDPEKTNTMTRLWWKCAKADCDHHIWESRVHDRIKKNSGCPFCAGKRTCPCLNLETEYPELAKQWHPSKNCALLPSQYTSSSKKRVWWLCSKSQCVHSHEWISDIGSRVQGNGCPFCSHRKICSCDSLAASHPQLLKFWDEKQNANGPDKVTAKSNLPISWVCPKCFHKWQRTPWDMTRDDRKESCPSCHASSQQDMKNAHVLRPMDEYSMHSIRQILREHKVQGRSTKAKTEAYELLTNLYVRLNGTSAKVEEATNISGLLQTQSSKLAVPTEDESKKDVIENEDTKTETKEANDIAVDRTGKGPTDGKINLTRIAKALQKPLGSYLITKTTETFLSSLTKQSDMRGVAPVVVIRGNTGGTWVIPAVARHFLAWAKVDPDLLGLPEPINETVPSQHIYIVPTEEPEHWKIGGTQNLEERLEHYQCRIVSRVNFEFTMPVHRWRHTETMFKRKYVKWRIKGEIYKCTLNELKEAIISCAIQSNEWFVTLGKFEEQNKVEQVRDALRHLDEEAAKLKGELNMLPSRPGVYLAEEKGELICGITQSDKTVGLGVPKVRGILLHPDKDWEVPLIYGYWPLGSDRHAAQVWALLRGSFRNHWTSSSGDRLKNLLADDAINKIQEVLRQSNQ